MLEHFKLHDVVQMKKPHACGENNWTIVRDGADIKIRCNGCGRVIMLDRLEFIKKGKKVLSEGSSVAGS